MEKEPTRPRMRGTLTGEQRENVGEWHTSDEDNIGLNALSNGNMTAAYMQQGESVATSVDISL